MQFEYEYDLSRLNEYVVYSILRSQSREIRLGVLWVLYKF